MNGAALPELPTFNPILQAMPLETGYYLIKNRNNYLGHSDEEPLLPQRVITLPGGVHAPKWFVKKEDDGRYIIKIDDHPTAKIDNKVFAITVDRGKFDYWYIVADERGGKDSYVITTTERYDGWVAPDSEKPYEQTEQ